MNPIQHLAVVVVNWNTRDLLRRCLRSLEEQPGEVATEIWVVDNASEDGSAEMVAEEFPHVHLRALRENVGFAAGNNVALREVDTEWVLLLNPDTEVLQGALVRALATGRQHGTAVTVRLLNPDGSLQPSAFRFPSILRDLAQALWVPRLLPRALRGRIFLGGYWSHDAFREVDWALGAFLLVPEEALEAAGLLPEKYPLFGEDLEWCFRLREAGYSLLFEPEAQVIHHGNQAAGQHPPSWRIRRTHDALEHFLRERRGPWAARLHRGVLLLNYLLRAGLFSVLGLGSTRRRRQASEYRLILKTLVAREEGRP